jgi:hypothetical protein
MSDRREWAKKTLAKLATEIGAWPRWKDNKAFQKALIDIRDDEAVVEIVAQFGGDKIPFEPLEKRANRLRDPAEEAPDG